MAELDILDTSKKKVGTVSVPAGIFEANVKDHLVQQYVTMQLAARRSGTASTISRRGDIRSSGRKPWRQKGTGRARAGTASSPIWRGGLTVFGPTPRDYRIKMSKKSKKLALKSVLSDRFRSQNIAVVERLELEQPKTKDAVKLMEELGLPKRTLFLLPERHSNLELAVRNLPHANVLSVEGLNVMDLLMHEKIVCTPETLKKIEERLS
ncbi:MAG: 50S ribosomal protein L4 [Nitrospinaceae bacterium]|nr:50S ribosomal protein L4 [Nitrospinaceae bacterium]NIR57628.1 50S ribosomal protein L4 [Nitrospinaceae bacterium]NIS88102.1 50S ribosomal protein L4 [Nitrospinaceae bacterium]NIT84966.1 50S ribosomal protein L4 [Nitrospinaceae bacterium]NIU47138.1 50S ribosomal protein L4 [Nitrospinaceae bacterium]